MAFFHPFLFFFFFLFFNIIFFAVPKSSRLKRSKCRVFKRTLIYFQKKKKKKLYFWLWVGLCMAYGFSFFDKIIIKYCGNLLKIVRFVVLCCVISSFFFLLMCLTLPLPHARKRISTRILYLLSYLISMSVSASISVLLLHYKILGNVSKTAKIEARMNINIQVWKERITEKCRDERRERKKKQTFATSTSTQHKAEYRIIKNFPTKCRIFANLQTVTPARQLSEKRTSRSKQEQADFLFLLASSPSPP